MVVVNEPRRIVPVLILAAALSIAIGGRGAVSGAGARAPARPVDPRNDLEQIVAEEAAALDRAAGFVTTIRILDDDRSDSSATGRINLSKSELLRINEVSKVERFREVVRLILAHEKAHQVQFRTYGATIMEKASVYERRVYECQADLLAGKYFTETMVDASPDDQLAILDALQVMFDLGVRDSPLSVDPTNEQRRTAVRLGMAAGTITNFQRLPPAPEVLGSINVLVDKLNIRPEETALPWSLRTARRIVHADSGADGAAVNVLFSDISINWHEDPAIHTVDIAYTCENTATRAIRLSLESQCDSVLRAKPTDTKAWQKWDVKNVEMTLKPREKHRVVQTLNWNADARYMPRVVFPPDRGALMSFEFVDSVARGPTDTLSAPMLSSDAEVGPFLDLILFGLCRGDAMALRGGPGRQIQNYRKYECTPEVPQSLETRVYVYDNGKPPYVSSPLYDGTSPQEAIQVYASWKKKLSRAYPSWTVQTDEDDKSNQEVEFDHDENESITLRYEQTPDSNECDVSLVLRNRGHN